MIVVDASVIATALGDDGPDGDHFRERLRGQSLIAPELIDLEVVSVWRRMGEAGRLDQRRAAFALEDLFGLPLRRVSHSHLVGRCWELRNKLTVYDAAYVALAELTGVSLWTADRSLSRAPGLTCEVEVLAV